MKTATKIVTMLIVLGRILVSLIVAQFWIYARPRILRYPGSRNTGGIKTALAVRSRISKSEARDNAMGKCNSAGDSCRVNGSGCAKLVVALTDNIIIVSGEKFPPFPFSINFNKEVHRLWTY